MKLILSILGALILEIIPLPLELLYLRPEFLLITMIYWALTMPYQISLTMVWLVGLVADLLHANILGERALLLSFIIFLVIKLQARIRLFPLRQQMVIIFLWVLLFKFIQFLILYIFASPLPPYSHWLSSLSTALCWPLLIYFLGPYYQAPYSHKHIGF